MDPTDTKAMSSLALAYVDKGDTEEAIHWLRRTVEVDPNSRAPLYNLAVMMTRNKRHAEAVPLLSQLLVVGVCVQVYLYYVHASVSLCAWKRRYIYDLCIYVAYTTTNWDVLWVDCTLLYNTTRENLYSQYILWPAFCFMKYH